MSKVCALIALPEGGVPPLEKVCGLPLLLRHLFVLREAGVRDALVVGELDGRGRKLLERSEGKIGVRARHFKPDDIEGILEALLDFEEVLLVDGRYGFEFLLLEAARKAGKGTALVDADPSQPEGTPKVSVSEGRVLSLSAPAGGVQFAGVAFLPWEWVEEALRSGARPTESVGFLLKVAEKHELRAINLAEISPYDPERRRPVKPTWRFLASRADVPKLRKALVYGTQKRTLDVMAWYVHRPVENRLTCLLAETPLTPNQMTALTLLVALCVALLFATKHLLAGALLALAVNIMDGLDGKLARAKGMTTKVGLLEHSLDLFYEQSWYIAYGYAAYSLSGGKLWVLAVLVGMLLFDSFARHIYMQFRQAVGISLSDVAPFDRAFRRFDGRRNIYSLYMLGGAIFGLPWVALCLMAFHAFLTATIYFARAVKHLKSADLGRLKVGE
ncbi:MAG TPA: hypothetical protein EYP65_00220 [Armatimonadetes bacterium]|nr:hypothetical protein [Armatimonadota bacterium]